jgi:hypothetical protein
LESELPAATDEISSRRVTWFLMAALVARLEKVAKSNPGVIAIGATIWTIILTEYPRLKILLPHNIVWSPVEKEGFDLHQPDEVMIERGMNYDVPLVFAEHTIVSDFAKRMNLFYFPWKERVGFVP